MQTTLNDPEDKYGVTTTFRIPADLKRQLADEAAVRGISLSQYNASILLSSHKHAAEESTQVSLLLQERRQLQEQLNQRKKELESQSQHIAMLEQKVSTLESEKHTLSKAERLVLSKLQKNRSVFEQFLSGKSTLISKEALRQAGFEPQFLTNVFNHDGKRYNCVFDVCYRMVGEQVMIDRLDPQTLC